MKKANIHTRVELPPTILTIFGATGDLSADYLLPAIFHMDMEGLLPDSFRLVAVGRRDLTTQTYLDFIIKKSSGLKKVTPSQKKHFLQHLIYYKGDLDNPKSFTPLAKMLADKDRPRHICYNRLYYFATAPQLFSPITKVLKHSGLLTACAAHERKVRILVEKPFGSDLKSARDLNRLLLEYFSEEQIYRIDHYLGKETVQNLMVVRFANSIFEPLWNSKFIDHIQLNILYDEHAGKRQYFDQAGILKDIVQNHALQMLALLVMQEPKELTAQHIREEKLKVLQSLKGFDAKTLASNVLRGQYQTYAKEVGKTTKTETFAILKTFINSKRWQGVPIYIRTGMALSKKVTEISVHFKEPLRCLFKNCASNILTFRIQPDESVHLRLNNKVPGFGVELAQGDYEFGYEKAFMSEIPSAYERLLLDFFQGDQRLFISSAEIEAAWKFVDSVSSKWQTSLPLYTYQPGSNGPKEAEEFMQKENKEWWTK